MLTGAANQLFLQVGICGYDDPSENVISASVEVTNNATRFFHKQATGGKNTAENPDPEAAIFATNFPHHYGWPDGKSYGGAWVMIRPRFSATPLASDVLQAIYETAGRYWSIPEEI